MDTSGTCTANSPTSATTTFTGLGCSGFNAPGTDYYIATDTVTDTSNGGVGTITIPVQLTNTYVDRRSP
jgi:hypothetical protein